MLTRRATELVRDALADTPVVLIVGPRQCGKSTLAQAFLEDGARTAVTLDDPDAYGLARTDPKGFLKTFPAPLLIDEIQRAPELFLALKAEVDRNRRPGMYLLTGSSNVLSLPKLADSLAGRMEVIDLAPFTQGELGQQQEGFVQGLLGGNLSGGPATPDIWERIVRGGFPEPALRASAARRSAWFQSYVRALLERDVRDLANIEGLAHLPRLLSHLASRVGQPINVSTLAVETAVPYTSLKRYLTLLEKVFLLEMVPAWSFEPARGAAKTPKAYLCDTGLLCHLVHLDERALAGDALKAAPILRNFVAQELLRQARFSPSGIVVSHLRTVRHLEVDFVVEEPGGGIAGVQVKAGPSASLDDAAGLRYLAELAGDRFAGGAVLHLGEEARPLAPGIRSLPISSLWTPSAGSDGKSVN